MLPDCKLIKKLQKSDHVVLVKTQTESVIEQNKSPEIDQLYGQLILGKGKKAI